MTEKPRILPVDAMEVARRPAEGVELPEEEDVARVHEAADPEDAHQHDKLEEETEAAQRGRTV